MFFQNIVDNPVFFWRWIFTVIVSITLHELAHGWTAIRLGDDTPIHTGHMTINPIVHMGPVSLLAMVLVGIAWGQMPIDPSRIRGRHGDAKVAAAGPAMNLGLAVVALTLLGLLQRYVPAFQVQEHYAVQNATTLLWIFGVVNVVLCLFNLLPVPPLDGARILASFHRGYDRWVSDPANSWVMFLLFPIAFFSARYIFAWVGDVAISFLQLVRGW